MTWWPATSTEQLGANQIVTTLNLPIFLRKHFPTQIFRCRLAPHRGGAQVQCPANGPMCEVLSNTRTRTMYGRFVYTGAVQSLEQPCAFVKEIRVATTKYGFVWTLSAIDMLTSHDEITINVSSSRKGPTPTRLPKRKVRTTMKATTRFLPCHPFASSSDLLSSTISMFHRMSHCTVRICLKKKSILKSC